MIQQRRPHPQKNSKAAPSTLEQLEPEELTREMTVGGSCFGSPTRISLLQRWISGVRVSTSQACPACETEQGTEAHLSGLCFSLSRGQCPRLPNALAVQRRASLSPSAPNTKARVFFRGKKQQSKHSSLKTHTHTHTHFEASHHSDATETWKAAPGQRAMDGMSQVCGPCPCCDCVCPHRPRVSPWFSGGLSSARLGVPSTARCVRQSFLMPTSGLQLGDRGTVDLL